jgi:hypothetical protein
MNFHLMRKITRSNKDAWGSRLKLPQTSIESQMKNYKGSAAPSSGKNLSTSKHEIEPGFI